MTTANILSQLGSPGVSTGFKNRIINGGMVLDQRNAGASITPSNGQYNLDRWVTYAAQSSKFTVQQNAGSVTPPVGFTNYLGITSSSAYSSISSDYFALTQKIEGYNIADLAWGTVNAKTVTLSFQVYSSLTGTFSGAILNSAETRSYPFAYSIPAANTWTTISVTIPGETSGTWLTTNGVGIQFVTNLGSGSSRLGTAGAWSSTNNLGVTGSVSVVGTNGATFYITGVQLEVGTTATNFEVRDYGRELILCQRYYERVNTLLWVTAWASSAYMTPYKVSKRTTTPTITTIPSSGTGAVYQVYGEINALVLFQTTAHSVAAGGLITMSDEL